MATIWKNICDRCGEESQSGDENAETLFGYPGAPVTAYFTFHNRSDNQELRLDLCESCGKETETHIRLFFSEKFWNIQKDT